MVIQAKKNNWADFGQKLKDDGKENLKLFQKVLKVLRQGKKKEDIYITNSNGKVLTENTEIMNRRYFQNLQQVRDGSKRGKRKKQ